MNLTRAFEAADLIATVAIPEVFALNVGLKADIELHQRVPEGALPHVLTAYIDVLLGVTESSDLSSVLYQGLGMFACEADQKHDCLVAPKEGGFEVVIPVPIPLIALTYEEVLRRTSEAMDPVLPRFVLAAFVERLAFHPPTDGTITFDAIFDAGVAKAGATAA